MRVGLGIPPVGLPIDLCTNIVRQAEERGRWWLLHHRADSLVKISKDYSERLGNEE